MTITLKMGQPVIIYTELGIPIQIQSCRDIDFNESEVKTSYADFCRYGFQIPFPKYKGQMIYRMDWFNV